MVFDLIRMRAKEIGALLGFSDESCNEVQRLAAMDPDDVLFVTFTPIEVVKHGRSLLAALFVVLCVWLPNERSSPWSSSPESLGCGE